jgi:hypothetical protein
MQSCGGAGAYWRGLEKKVIVCYELAEEFADLYRNLGRSMAFEVGGKTSETPPPREASALKPQKQRGLRANRTVR